MLNIIECFRSHLSKISHTIYEKQKHGVLTSIADCAKIQLKEDSDVAAVLDKLGVIVTPVIWLVRCSRI